MPTLPRVSCLKDFVEVVEGLCSDWGTLNSTTHPWFRGQNLASWSLRPGIYRGWVDPTREREILRDFSLKAIPHLLRQPENDLEWLFVMQHHGMPTRLLDWTESYLYALYFAVCAYDGRKDSAVWVLDPWALNKHAIGVESVPVTTNQALRKHYPRDGGPDASSPVALRPAYGSARILAQKGVFTIHGSERSGLDEQAPPEGLAERLVRVAIRGNCKKSILRELHRAGITASTVFPDLQGLCAEIGFRYSRDYMGAHRRPKKPTPTKAGREPASKRKKWTPGSAPAIITSKTRQAYSKVPPDLRRRKHNESSETIK